MPSLDMIESPTVVRTAGSARASSSSRATARVGTGRDHHFTLEPKKSKFYSELHLQLPKQEIK